MGVKRCEKIYLIGIFSLPDQMLHLLRTLLLTPLSSASAETISTYFLNAKFSLLSPLPYEKPADLECLKTTGQFVLPRGQISMCFRSRPMSMVHPRHAGVTWLGLGTMEQEDVEMAEGFLYGLYETGPWIGVKRRDSQTYAWIGGGAGDGFSFQVIRAAWLGLQSSMSGN